MQACSDHSPLLISTGGFIHIVLHNRPFRFQAAWVTYNRFDDLVKDKWFSHYPLVSNLSNLASELTTWNKEVFGNLSHRKCQLWPRIEGIQKSLALGEPRYLLKLDRRLCQELNQTLDRLQRYGSKRHR